MSCWREEMYTLALLKAEDTNWENKEISQLTNYSQPVCDGHIELDKSMDQIKQHW